jgi:hypothetical protein
MNAKAELIPASQQPQGGQVVQASATTLLQVIQQAATNPQVDIDKMERLMAMHERMQAREAETAWNDAMAACQRELRQVAPDAFNSQTKSRYATYSALDAILRPVYAKHGFSLSFDSDASPVEECIRVIALVSRGGFTRTYKIDMPRDGKGAKGGDVMTKTHATGAGMQYGMRYLLKGIFNVAIGDLDNDGNQPKGGPEPDEEGKAKLEACGSLAGLQEVWKALTAAQRKTLGPIKDACKARIEDADREAAR